MLPSKYESMWKIMKNNKLKIESENLNDYLCYICNEVMKNACNVPCGCRYCYECLKNYLDGKEKICPGQTDYCKEEMINIDKNVHIDQSINMKIAKLKVKCPQQLCDYKGELNRLDNHMRLCNNKSIKCPFSDIGCRKNSIISKEINEHLSSDLYKHNILLMEWMNNCGNETESLKNNIVEINKKLSLKEVEILNLNETMSEMRSINLSNNMTNKSITEEMKREITSLKNQIKVMKEESESMKILVRNLQNNEDNTKTSIDKINKDITFLKIENRSLKDKKLESINKSDQIEVKIENKEIARLKKDLASMKDDIAILKIQMEWNEKDIMKHSQHINEQNVIEVEPLIPQNDHISIEEVFGEITWCIDGFTEKIMEANRGINTEIYSDFFYTHKDGYKVRIEIYPDGYDDGKGTHISIFFCIMRGDFDDYLEWPYKHEVTFALINQDTGLVHYSKTLGTESLQYHVNRNRPTTDQNSGLGYSKFFAHDDLWSNRAICKKDSICIKCIVQM